MTEEQKKQGIALAVKLGIFGVIGFLVAPFVYIAIGGLIGLIVAGLIGLGAINFAPVVAMKIANLKMKSITKEASENPIETMKNVYIENEKIIKSKAENIREFAATVGDYRNKMDQFKIKWPEDSAQFEGKYNLMVLSLKKKKEKYAFALKKQEEYAGMMEKSEAIYDMALAESKVDKLDDDVEAQVFRNIKTKVAFDSVNHAFNLAVADLTTEVDDVSSLNVIETKSLTGASNSDTIDAQFTVSNEKVTVKRN